MYDPRMDRREFLGASVVLAATPAAASPGQPREPDGSFEVYRHINEDGSWEDREVPAGWRVKNFGIHSYVNSPLLGFDMDFAFVAASVDTMLETQTLLPNAAVGLCFLMSHGRPWISKEKIWVSLRSDPVGSWDPRLGRLRQDVISRAVDLRTLQALYGAREEGRIATRLEDARFRRELRLLIRGVIVHFVGSPL